MARGRGSRWSSTATRGTAWPTSTTASPTRSRQRLRRPRRHDARGLSGGPRERQGRRLPDAPGRDGHVRGSVGNRAGIQMREYKQAKPFLIVGETADDYLGEYMAGGVIAILNLAGSDRPVGKFAATGLVGGTLYIRGELDATQMGLPPPARRTSSPTSRRSSATAGSRKMSSRRSRSSTTRARGTSPPCCLRALLAQGPVPLLLEQVHQVPDRRVPAPQRRRPGCPQGNARGVLRDLRPPALPARDSCSAPSSPSCVPASRRSRHPSHRRKSRWKSSAPCGHQPETQREEKRREEKTQCRARPKTSGGSSRRQTIKVTPRQSVLTASMIMQRRNFRHLPVVDEKGKMMGMISAQDIIDSLNFVFSRPDVSDGGGDRVARDTRREDHGLQQHLRRAGGRPG